MSPEIRAREGLVPCVFSIRVEIPGVSNANFIQNCTRTKFDKHRGLEALDAMDFLQLMRERAKLVEIDQTFLKRSVNEGFSGGEKKRNEIFQMAMLEPKLSIMDETDSGLDIDALKVVSNGVNKLRNNENGFVVITHYQRLLNYIVPDFVHVLVDGKIVKTGGKELAFKLEEIGYDWVKDHINEL